MVHAPHPFFQGEVRVRGIAFEQLIKALCSAGHIAPIEAGEYLAQAPRQLAKGAKMDLAQRSTRRGIYGKDAPQDLGLRAAIALAALWVRHQPVDEAERHLKACVFVTV